LVKDSKSKKADIHLSAFLLLWYNKHRIIKVNEILCSFTIYEYLNYKEILSLLSEKELSIERKSPDKILIKSN
jgi:hypothetical protein